MAVRLDWYFPKDKLPEIDASILFIAKRGREMHSGSVIDIEPNLVWVVSDDESSFATDGILCWAYAPEFPQAIWDKWQKSITNA